MNHPEIINLQKFLHRTFNNRNIDVRPRAKLNDSVEFFIGEESIWLIHVYDEDAHEHAWDADAVVLVTQRRSNEALFRSLKDDIGLDRLETEGVQALYRIGDCEAPRLIADAVFSGHRLAREIDTEDPSIPLPYKRERKVVERELAAL